MKIRNALLSLTILCALTQSTAAQDCSLAEPPSLDGVISIDARTGSFEGSRRYRVGDQTRVVVYNKNPFRYSYVLTIHEAVIVEDAIGKFLTFAGISATDAPAETQPETPPGDDTDAPESAAPEPTPTQRTACNNTIKDLDERHALIEAGRKALKKAVENEIKHYEAFTADVKTRLQNPQTTGRQLCETAKAVVAEIRAFKPEDETLEKKVADLKALAKKQKEAIDAVKAPCKPPKLAEYKALVETVEDLTEWADEKLEELADREKDLGKLADNVQTTLGKADAFWESRVVGPHNANTEVKISLTSTDTTVANATAKTIRPEVIVNFGAGKRFFMAGGIAASAADRTRFKTIDGFILDRQGKPVLDSDSKPTSGKVVGIEEDSVGRVSPAILLHGMIWRPKKGVDGIGLSLGVGAAGSDETIIQYFVGPTISLADDHLFVTLGAFRGQETKLGGDFYVGAPVPATTTLPTVQRTSWTVGLSLTYRIP